MKLSATNFIQDALRHHQRGQLKQAEALYLKALSRDGKNADAWHLLGVIAHQTDRHGIAVEHIKKAIALKPDYADFHVNLGNALQALDRFEEAAECYLRAIALNPNIPVAHNNLGNTLESLGRRDEAISCFEQALRLKPDYSDALNNLGLTLKAQNRLDEAISCFTRSLAIDPHSASSYYNLANTCKQQGHIDQAIDYYRKAVAINPDFIEAQNNLGIALKETWQTQEAHACFKKAISLNPDLMTVQSNYLFTLQLDPTITMQEIHDEHCRWAERHAALFPANRPPFTNTRDPNRRLRIGYVSPDFRRHAVAFFVEPILASHDHALVEIFCYAEVKHPDDVTERFQYYADHWHSTIGLSDEAVAQLISSHHIDILVDLAGHTEHNRLLAFARKPAPIQVTYLGYPSTTGLAAMDYRLTDWYADPPGMESYYTEALLRLPNSLWCYRAPPHMPEIAPLPALQNGYITFGSFTGFPRVGKDVVALWARLLHAVPNSKLLLVRFPEGDVRRRTEVRFAMHGIPAERLEFLGPLPPAEFLKAYMRADIALDAFPVNGATTTCETLWMGIPTISLAGDRFIARAGISVLTAADLADFVASSEEHYLAIAAHLANDLPLLAEFHDGLRAHVAASPLTDAVGFTRHLENIFREIWVKWCEENR